jgi:hypothetical protein
VTATGEVEIRGAQRFQRKTELEDSMSHDIDQVK